VDDEAMPVDFDKLASVPVSRRKPEQRAEDLENWSRNKGIPVPTEDNFDCNCVFDLTGLFGINDRTGLVGTNLVCGRFLECGEEGQRACCDCETVLYNIPGCESGSVE
jgi:hypothetical protein